MKKINRHAILPAAGRLLPLFCLMLALTLVLLPAAQRADYELFAARCARCHSLARPLSARVSDETHWRRYVERMRRQPGAMITAEEGERIVRFLTWYTSPADGGVR